jgi:hypothetical protein
VSQQHADLARAATTDFCREATFSTSAKSSILPSPQPPSSKASRHNATPSIAKRAADLQAFRIAPDDSNYFACMLGPFADGVSVNVCRLILYYFVGVRGAAVMWLTNGAISSLVVADGIISNTIADARATTTTA